MPIVWPSVAIVDGSKAIAWASMSVARLSEAIARLQMAVDGMLVAVDFFPTSIAWKLNQAPAPCDSDQRTAKRTNSEADFNFSFALMFAR